MPFLNAHCNRHSFATLIDALKYRESHQNVAKVFFFSILLVVADWNLILQQLKSASTVYYG